MRWNIGSWDARNDAGDLIARVKLLDYPTGAEYRVEWCGERHAPRTFSSMVQAMRNVEELDYREREKAAADHAVPASMRWMEGQARKLPEAGVLHRPDALQRAYDWLTGPPLSGPPLSGLPVEHPSIVDSGADWEDKAADDDEGIDWGEDSEGIPPEEAAEYEEVRDKFVPLYSGGHPPIVFDSGVALCPGGIINDNHDCPAHPRQDEADHG